MTRNKLSRPSLTWSSRTIVCSSWAPTCRSDTRTRRCRVERQLAAALAREVGQPAGETDLATTALLFEGARGRNALVRRVVDLLDRPGCRPTALHRQVAALPFRAIITTAQDRLLERAFDDAGKRHSAVLTDVETPYIEEDRVMLYKLHGCVTRPDTLVLTRKDHALFALRGLREPSRPRVPNPPS